FPGLPSPFSLLLVSCVSRRDHACNKFAKLVMRLMLIMFPGGEHGPSVARFPGPVNLSFGFEDGHADLDYDDARAGRSMCGFLRGFVFACKFFFDLLKPRPNSSI